ncbi:MAG: hypothetical protein KDD62_14900, partial [Bdellovibrionales bacterium]|nr:hypothetical protein [Bdellovibrionales bacterium]
RLDHKLKHPRPHTLFCSISKGHYLLFPNLMSLSLPHRIVDRCLPATPFILGLVLGVRASSYQEQLNLIELSFLLLVLGIASVLLATSMRKWIELKRKDTPCLSSAMIGGASFLICLIAIGVIRLHAAPLAFVLCIAWWVMLTAAAYRNSSSVTLLDAILKLCSYSLLGILGFTFANVPVSPPVLLLSIAYSTCLSSLGFVSELTERPRSTVFRRATAMCLALGPCLVMVVASFGFLESSYIGVVFLLFLLLPLLEQILQTKEIISKAWIAQLRMFIVLFLGVLLLLELAITMQAVSKFLEQNT